MYMNGIIYISTKYSTSKFMTTNKIINISDFKTQLQNIPRRWHTAVYDGGWFWGRKIITVLEPTTVSRAALIWGGAVKISDIYGCGIILFRISIKTLTPENNKHWCLKIY